ncbi:MAG: rhodanese-like domain-containing protein [Lacipirellulaceae bacterium]
MPTLLALCLLLQLNAGRPTVEHTKDSLATVQQRVAEGEAVLVDVRSKEEWDKGHVAGAVLLPVDSLRKHSLDREKLAETLPDDKPLYLYCEVGMRSKAAAVILKREGYEARPLKQGYRDLVAAGFEDERP